MNEVDLIFTNQALERAAVAVLDDLRRGPCAPPGDRRHSLAPPLERKGPPGWRRRVARAIRSDRTVPAGAATVLLLACLRQVVGSPVVVLANQGDFNRVLSPVGLRSTGPPFSLQYGWLHYVDGHTSTAGHYLTSFLPLAGLASLASHTVLGGSIDVRVVGVVYTVGVAASAYLLCRNLASRAAQVAAAGLVVVGLSDSHLVAYLNTWYDEPWSLLVLMWIVIVILGARPAGFLTARRRAALTGLCCLLVTAKSQDALLAVPLAVAVVFIGRPPGCRRRSGTQRLVRAGCGITVAVVGLSYLALQSPVYGNESQYDLIFADLLVHQPRPASVLKDLGLPAQMIAYRGTNAYEPRSAFRSPAFQGFEHHGGKEHVLVYLAGHPLTAMELLGRGMHLGWQTRLDYLGYHTADSHRPPFGDACEPCIYSGMTRHISGAGIWLTLMLYGLAVLVARAARRAAMPQVSDALLVLTGVSVVALCAAVFGEGSYEEIKHLYLFYVANLLVLAATAATAARLFADKPELRRTEPIWNLGALDVTKP